MDSSKSIELALLRRDIAETDFADLRLGIVTDDQGLVIFAAFGSKIELLAGEPVIGGLLTKVHQRLQYMAMILADRVWQQIKPGASRHGSSNHLFALAQHMLTGVRRFMFVNSVDAQRHVVDDIQSALTSLLDASLADPVQIVLTVAQIESCFRSVAGRKLGNDQVRKLLKSAEPILGMRPTSYRLDDVQVAFAGTKYSFDPSRLK